MIISLLLLPFFLLLASMYLYRYTGKKTILHFDVVQFIYAFVIYPVVYIWLQNFIFVLLREEIGISLTIPQWIAINSVFSVTFMFFYAFGIIHSLTKTFALEMERDPLFDLFAHSEYFHEVASHIGIYVIAGVVFSLLALLNVFFSLPIELGKQLFFAVLLVAAASGFFIYIGLFTLTDIESAMYRRVMKLTTGSIFTFLALLYIFFRPPFSSPHLFYWFTFVCMAMTVLSILFMNPSRRMVRFFESWKHD